MAHLIKSMKVTGLPLRLKIGLPDSLRAVRGLGLHNPESTKSGFGDAPGRGCILCCRSYTSGEKHFVKPAKHFDLPTTLSETCKDIRNPF